MNIAFPGAIGQILQLINQGGQQQQPQGNPLAGGKEALPLLRPGSQHTGIITAQAAGGRLTLTLKTGDTVQLQQAGKPLPVGTQVTIKITPEGGAQILTLQLPGTSVQADLVTTFANRWPGLVQALSVLQNNAPRQATQVINRLPQLSNLFSGLVNFAQAVQTGQQTPMFGETLSQALVALGVDLSPDLANLQQLQQPQPTNQEGWKSLLFPYIEHDGESPRQGGFFWREQKSAEDNPKGRADIRFIVQLETQAHGPVQLDGLWHERTVHLKLRLHHAPAPDFADGLRAVTHNAFSAYGLEGSIQIEITPTFPTNPLQDTVGIQHSDYNFST